ncbi:iron-containing alcohol dehydrogenase [Mycena pura]|uniref:Iron-containing alcohol dehydrogenase n=1 Tax=Mycena pura TaxID=153505 RepID=A0AAD6YVM1_9AGAR|nr:iron-containing alcohol dehydrogenase [Mycena pura]
MQSFVYNALPGRVVFGRGSLSQVGQEIKGLGCSKALVVTGPFHATAGDALRANLGALAVGVYSKATMHTPTGVTEEAVQLATELGADCVVALGGSSTVGLAKAIALRTDFPQIVVPTTYAGSEATAIIGQTENGVKITQKSPKVLPEVIIYDADLTLSLPARMTVTSGINAIAHAVEALYAADANPISDMYAEQGIAHIARALTALAADLKNADARSDALFGAFACSVCAGTVGVALHHKLCHTLGGMCNLPHSDTHAVVLPHAIAYNAPYAKAAMAKVARCLGLNTGPGGASAAQGVYDLARSLGAPCSLKQLGMREEDLERAADAVMARPYPNPAPLERERILALLRDAFEGRRPE